MTNGIMVDQPSLTPFQHAIRYWIFPLMLTASGAGLGVWKALQLQQTYKVECTFFVLDPAATASQSIISGYSSLLGSPVGGTDQKIIALAQSNTMKTFVTKGLSSITAAPVPLDEFLIRQEDKSKLIHIQFVSTDILIANKVVKLYMNGLQLYYEKLELAAARNAIQVLDAPYVEKVPLINRRLIVGGAITGAGAGIGFLLSMVLSVLVSRFRSNS
jgi:hypothetical protein